MDIGTFEEEIKRFGRIVEKLRGRQTVTIFDGQDRTFYRFRLNPNEKSVCWIQEASLDRNNWVNQYPFCSLRGVLRRVYDNKVKNNIDD